jgi:hypothetical protein
LANTFEKLRAKAGDGQKSIDWYMRNVKNLVGARVTQSSVLRSDIGAPQSNIEIGSMYLYLYDPKWKDQLPFYDTFPLVLPFGPAAGGFYGINLHYLPYMIRAQVLGELLDYTNSKIYSSTTKMKMSYSLLQNLSNAAEIKPCIKHYLTSHVQSRFLKINPEDWKTAVFLPVEAFKGATKEQVFADSRSKF